MTVNIISVKGALGILSFVMIMFGVPVTKTSGFGITRYVEKISWKFLTLTAYCQEDHAKCDCITTKSPRHIVYCAATVIFYTAGCVYRVVKLRQQLLLICATSRRSSFRKL
jgi:hypothetical protein